MHFWPQSKDPLLCWLQLSGYAMETGFWTGYGILYLPHFGSVSSHIKTHCKKILTVHMAIQYQSKCVCVCEREGETQKESINITLWLIHAAIIEVVVVKRVSVNTLLTQFGNFSRGNSRLLSPDLREASSSSVNYPAFVSMSLMLAAATWTKCIKLITWWMSFVLVWVPGRQYAQ